MFTCRQTDTMTDGQAWRKQKAFCEYAMAIIKGIRSLTLDLAVCKLFQGTNVRLYLLLGSD